MSTSELALAVGLTAARVRQLTDSGVFVRADRGRYALIENLKRHRDHVAAEHRKALDAQPNAEVEARIRKRTAEADLAELDLEERRGELLPAGDVERGWLGMLEGLSKRLLAVPAKIAAELASLEKPTECHDVVTEAIHEALTEVADGVAAAGDPPRSR